jgi:protocatechuate 3,4-dioxygenase beta subunit
MTLRPFGLLLAAAVMTLAQVSPAPPADKPKEKSKVEGRVTSLATGEPVRKATLRLRGAMTAQPVNAADIPAYQSITDNEGKFLFEDIDPGRYTLMAERAGFVRQTYGASSPTRPGTLLTLDPGQHLKDLVFKLTPQGVITGKAGDEDGDPLPNISVQVYRQAYVRGKKQLQQTGSAMANAEGVFTVANLAPGRYYLSASDTRVMMPGMRERQGRRGPEEGYVPTYYPNATDPSAAAAIDVAAGAEVRGIEIRLRKTRVFHIAGKVVSPGTLQNTMLMLTPRNPSSGSVNFFRPTMSMVRGDGGFEFGNVQPGTYVIQNQPTGMNNTESAPLVVRHEVTIGDESIEDLVLSMAPGPEIKGTFKTEGADPKAPATPAVRPRITLMVTEGMSFNTPQAQANDDGTFQLRGIAPNKYMVNVFGLPDGTYVKSVRFGGQEVLSAGLDLTSGSGGTIEITLSANAADVSGVVRDSKGSAVKGVQVTLWNPTAAPTGVYEPPKFANTDQNGAFRIRNLAPGQYKIVAWEDIEPGLSQDPGFRSHFESQASSVTLRDNSHESVEVKVVPKEAIDAEIAKLP